jgi:hypothetical protein
MHLGGVLDRRVQKAVGVKLMLYRRREKGLSA